MVTEESVCKDCKKYKPGRKTNCAIAERYKGQMTIIRCPDIDRKDDE